MVRRSKGYCFQSRRSGEGEVDIGAHAADRAAIVVPVHPRRIPGAELHPQRRRYPNAPAIVRLHRVLSTYNPSGDVTQNSSVSLARKPLAVRRNVVR
jgi:hypothetical protein